ncbi:MAG: hypothetical protein R3185_02590 [Candidatus Thermoplasmatota archaeon]|nr:hypothetical protein [Candidatus Thermoplasmatota archaeon]
MTSGEHTAPTDTSAEGYFRVSEDEKERRRRVREALAAEGFKWEIWQKPEKDMVFGMIRTEEDMQVHVRYYRGGYIKAETEIAHHYFEHLISPRESAHDHVEDLLAKHGIEDVDVFEKEFPERMKGDMPRTRTPWKPVVAAAGAVLVGAFYGARTLLWRD